MPDKFQIYKKFIDTHLRPNSVLFKPDLLEELNIFLLEYTGKTLVFKNNNRKPIKVKYEEFYMWLRTHKGKHPSIVSKDAYERKLHIFYTSCKSRKKNHIEFLDTVDSIKREFNTLEKTLEEKYDEIYKWVETHEGNLPSSVSNIIEEKILYNFYANCKYFKHKHHNFLNKLKNIQKKYKSNKSQKEKYEEYYDWFRTHNGKSPSYYAKNFAHRINEYRLHKFYFQCLKRKHLHAQFLNEVDEIKKEFGVYKKHQTLEEKYEEFYTWMKGHNGNLPSRTIKEEEKLAYFYKNCKKNPKHSIFILKVEEIKKEHT